jgi:uncharacterized membrane protein YagU involved in acid resistance
MRVSLKSFLATLVGGLIAGTLDITYACVYSYLRRGTPPATILQSVASGAFGQRAFTDGARMVVLGGIFHFLIAITAAVVYFLASRLVRFLITQAVICGVIYGVCVYLFMNLVVLPLSAIPFKMSYPWPSLIGGLLIHMFGIGLPISLAVRWGSKSST